MGLSLAERVARLPVDQRTAWINAQPTDVLTEMARGEWWWVARPEQIPPPGDWLVHLALAGRGWGKSRAGAEWIVEQTQLHPFDRHGAPTEWLVIAETLSDARTICMEGPAGILRVLDRRGIKHRYKQSPRPMVIFPDKTKIYCEGADDADVGRGYNAAGGWLDEICKWAYSYDSWYQGIMPSLRADLRGDHPRVFATTTPKPIKLLQEWVKRQDGTVSIVSGSTFDNRANLSALVLKELLTRYEGTTIGRQELYGELLEAIEGALFKRSDINRTRVQEVEERITSVVVGVDPGLTDDGDEMGVVVVGRNNKSNSLYVLADRSVTGAGREAATHVWRVAAEFGADWVVVETNLGKRWMTDVFNDAYVELMKDGLFPENTTPPVKTVDAKVGKMTRAQPVAMRYEQARVHHVGLFPELEDEMVCYTGEERESPNRMDALVHAARWLMQQEKRTMRFASPISIDAQFERLTQELNLT
jgi:phage terminase large subunit-like protein